MQAVKWLWPLSLSSLLVVADAGNSFGQSVDFAHQIVPILQKHCVACHGGREAKGSFSLNSRELLVNSGHVDLTAADQSYLLELIASEDADMQMPPPEKPRVSAQEKDLLMRWIAEGARWDDGFSFAPQSYEPPLKPRRPILPEASNDRQHPIDRILDKAIISEGGTPPPLVSDAQFLRRVSLDLVGLLPSPEQLKQFLADQSPDKRARIVDELLQNKIAYADHWMTFFNDLLRNDYSGTGFITNGRSQISTWLYESLVENKPYDIMARELIAPSTAASQGYSDGIRWRGEVSAGQTVEIQFAQSISQSFLGINMKCASCHDSFIDRWKLDEAYGLAAIYSTRPLDIHRCDKPIGRQAEAKWLFPEIGQIDAKAPRDMRLKQLADLMTHPENGRFARTMANRLWYKTMGRGIVHPLDAMQSQPWNEDLLDFLAVELAENKYDLKYLLKLIVTSHAYQSQSVTEAVDSSGRFTFRGPIPRRMTAEQFLDGVWQITSAAPTAIDAPVFRSLPSEADSNSTSPIIAQWIWGDSAAEGQIPPAGETISLRKQFTLDQIPLRGGAVITCDNSFQVYINNRLAGSGDDWTESQAIPLKDQFKKGNNEIVIIASNAGSSPNPAGLFFQAELVMPDQQSITIASDATWQFNSNLPKPKEGRLGGISGKWSPITVVPPLAAWTNAVNSQISGKLAQATSGNVVLARASLLHNNAFMKSLGRPARDQIVSMRPSELTTLEAIDLSNGETLAKALSQGAAQLATQNWESPADMVVHLFQFAYSRQPSEEELAAATEYLGDQYKSSEIEDLLWSLVVSPEFMVVR